MIISVTNQKGGVGKTTTAVNIVSALKNQGYSVLAVDMDPQCNFSIDLGGDRNQPGIYELFKNISDCCLIQGTKSTVSLLVGSELLSSADVDFRLPNRYTILKEFLDRVKSLYDYIIIDTPPHLGLLAINAYVASDKLVIPVEVDKHSIVGLYQLYNTYLDVKGNFNPRLKIGGILITKFNKRNAISRQFREQAGNIANEMGIRLYNTEIRQSIAVVESRYNCQSVIDYKKRSTAAQDYLEFVKELIGGQ